MHVAVCDLNEHWWSDRRNLASVPLWKWYRSSPIYLRDWPPPAVLGVERLLGAVEALSTLVCLDSSHSRRYCYHPRGLCVNYQHTGCLSALFYSLEFFSFCFLKECYKLVWRLYRNFSWISSDSNASGHPSQNCVLSEGGTCWFKFSSHIAILVRGARTHLQKLCITNGGKGNVDLQIMDVVCIRPKCLLTTSILVLIIYDTMVLSTNVLWPPAHLSSISNAGWSLHLHQQRAWALYKYQ